MRKLKAKEIECRVSKLTDKTITILLYKDARCDMNILDETYGELGWKREHSRDNANCTVSIWNDKIKQWITKEDTGKESNSEAAKGLASDSFKRACFNWGIGRELYTAPVVRFKYKDGELNENGAKKSIWTKFHIDTISYDEDGNINVLVVKDDKGVIRFANNMPKEKNKELTGSMSITKGQEQILEDMIKDTKTDKKKFLEYFKVDNITKLNFVQAEEAKKILEKKFEKGE